MLFPSSLLFRTSTCVQFVKIKLGMSIRWRSWAWIWTKSRQTIWNKPIHKRRASNRSNDAFNRWCMLVAVKSSNVVNHLVWRWNVSLLIRKFANEKRMVVVRFANSSSHCAAIMQNIAMKSNVWFHSVRISSTSWSSNNLRSVYNKRNCCVVVLLSWILVQRRWWRHRRPFVDHRIRRQVLDWCRKYKAMPCRSPIKWVA